MNPESSRILVIDDEVGMRQGCRRALAPHGYQVSVAENGAEGLRQLRAREYDLAILDAMMPGLSGLELLERIHEHDPDMVCIMITGYATVDLATQAMKQGAHSFLPKPFTSDELLEAVHRALQDRTLRLEAQRQEQRAEEALEMERVLSEEAKLDTIVSRFMLVVVHELRNPAGVIKNYVQLMRAGYVDEDEWDEYLAKLDKRSGQLLDMLDDLLELAHLKQGVDILDLQEVAASGILTSVADELRPLADAKGLVLEVRIGTEPSLRIRPSHLVSLWTHLLDNAIRYTANGAVTVTLDIEDGCAVTTVIDTGMGISTEELGRIFQEFYRSEAAREEVEVGTGLGLPIVNQIVKAYHGTIDVDSQPGRGSIYTVRLPIAPRTDSGVERAED